MGFQRAAQPLEATTIPLPGNRKRDFFAPYNGKHHHPKGTHPPKRPVAFHGVRLKQACLRRKGTNSQMR